ncbi:hypothetical protein TRAPUB_1978 [Trametes pubescens]|uniref:Uncharacterized protein n=1 Tax=Trametes pubescens TaxID=154538 RepID=A0A1M2VI12_TRAPU|nr:hypothetical protein TRAPUB_1978 [Trametes pubescens]
MTSSRTTASSAPSRLRELELDALADPVVPGPAQCTLFLQAQVHWGPRHAERRYPSDACAALDEPLSTSDM